MIACDGADSFADTQDAWDIPSHCAILVSLLRPASPHTRARPVCWMMKPAVLMLQGRPPPFGFRASAAATALSGLAKLGMCQPTSADISTAGSASVSASNSSGVLSAGRALHDHGVSPTQQNMQQQQRQQQQEAADQMAEPLRVLAAALADGAAELNASQLAQVQAPSLVRLNLRCVIPV